MKSSSVTPEFLDEIMELIDRTRYPAVNFSIGYDLESSGYVIKKDDALSFIFECLEFFEANLRFHSSSYLTYLFRESLFEYPKPFR